MLEIGPGLGALTEALSSRCEKLIAIEYDKTLCSFLKRYFVNAENIEVVCADILDYKLSTINYRLKVIGNLPYYITSPIITYLIDNKKYIEQGFITVQKEVAERLISQPGRKSYGSLSCFVQFYCKPTIELYIPKNVFYPQPKVDSALVNLKFLDNPSVEVKDEKLFFKVIRAAFNQRRKTLLNALWAADISGADKPKLNKILLNAGIDPKRRGETLSLKEFARLTEELS